MTLISVVVPTIRGREHWYERCKNAYVRTSGDIEIIVVLDKATVGEAWQEGAERASGKYLHLTNDDCEPLWPDWWKAAIDAADRGLTPAGPIYNTDGSLQSCGEWVDEARDDGTPTRMTRIPFCSMEQWGQIGPMLPVHYFSDNWFSWRALQNGIQPVIATAYAFVHHIAPEGRRGGEAADHATYRAAGGR